jgi:hypothetical protein
MHNKPRNWTDVKLIISSFSIAITLGVWGLFASHEKSGSGVSGVAAVGSQQPDMLVSTNNTTTSPGLLLPGQKLLFGTNLQSATQLQSQLLTQPQVQAQPTPAIVVRKKHGGNGNGGGGGGGGGSVTSSHSSHP